jgi:hypothetical protein
MRCRQLQSFDPNDELAQLLINDGIEEAVVRNTLESGYYMRDWVIPGSGQTYRTVSDLMYGNKQFSSSFDFHQFVRYLRHDYAFEPLPPFREVVVRNTREIKSVLEDPIRQKYLSEGSMSFRGQWREYRFRRSVPNPRRAAPDGAELSVIPGLYRQSGPEYGFSVDFSYTNSLGFFLEKLEPKNPHVYAESFYAYDIVRAEQHYAAPTGGLDLSFDIETALFFATHKFHMSDGLATYDRVIPGSHTGVIYCFRFGSPTVNKTEYLIRDFDLFKTYRPERILRQACALPQIGDFERNIAVTEIDCIIRLHRDFEYDGTLTPEYIFPASKKDAFYRKLLELKDRCPKELAGIVEYSWARA